MFASSLFGEQNLVQRYPYLSFFAGPGFQGLSFYGSDLGKIKKNGTEFQVTDHPIWCETKLPFFVLVEHFLIETAARSSVGVSYF